MDITSNSSYPMHMESAIFMHDSRARNESPLIEKSLASHCLNDKSTNHSPIVQQKAKVGVPCIPPVPYPVINYLNKSCP